MSVLAIIPAKGYSKELPGKNKRLMHGKPLFMWSVEQALAARKLNSVCVSSDDEEILRMAEQAGAVPLCRPVELCQDNIPLEAVMAHAIAPTVDKIVVLLQPTNPCRTPQDIDAAISFVRDKGYDSLLSVVSNHRFLWRQEGLIPYSINYDWQKRPNRQNMPPQYMENGCIYASRLPMTNRLQGRIRLQLMDYWSAFEIDSEEDWDLVEFAMGKKGLIDNIPNHGERRLINGH